MSLHASDDLTCSYLGNRRIKFMRELDFQMGSNFEHKLEICLHGPLPRPKIIKTYVGPDIPGFVKPKEEESDYEDSMVKYVCWCLRGSFVERQRGANGIISLLGNPKDNLVVLED